MALTWGLFAVILLWLFVASWLLSDIAGQIRFIVRKLLDIEHDMFDIREGVIELMSDQEKLNQDVAALTEALTSIEAEIASLKAQPGAQALDFSGLDAVVTRAKGDEPTTEAPQQPPATPTP